MDIAKVRGRLDRDLTFYKKELLTLSRQLASSKDRSLLEQIIETKRAIDYVIQQIINIK